MNRALGVCYYPEHWPRSQWADDAARMVAAGLRWVRIGEFAWSKLEPRPGELEFEWLDEAIAVLAQAGLRIIMGTPTATPPRWMLTRHPDMLAVDADGRPRRFGSRRHYCFSHLGYQAECDRIVTLLAERYGNHPAIGAWQTDNEYGCHDTTLSYSAAAAAAFRHWLQQRYGTVDALNAAWGNAFWSMEYSGFEEIDPPNLTVTEPNPAHGLAYRRFASHQVVAFNQRQTKILRRHTTAPLTHNYMGRELAFDHFDVGADLDIASWDSYPLGFRLDRSPGVDRSDHRYLRQGDPDLQAFHHDLYRAVGRGRWWVMEQQPGPVNWAPYNPDPLPGIVRLWSWEAFAHGAELVSIFRWRQAPVAQEQMHAGLLRPDGAPASALAEISQVAQELAAMPSTDVLKAPVALMFDYPSQWAWETQPQGADFDYFHLCLDAYRALRRAGLSVDIIPAQPEALAGYGLVLVPGLLTINPALAAAFAARPGEVLIGPRAGLKTPELSIALPLGPTLEGLDVAVARVESLPPGAEIKLSQGEVFTRWFEITDPSPHTAETTQDGHAALLRSGNQAYLTGWPNPATWDRLIDQACTRLGIATTPMPDGVRQRDTATHRFVFNYNPEPVLFDGKTIPAAGVHWRALEHHD